MTRVSSLTAQPLTPGDNFNWVFLVELLVCGILVIFFLFYFNRLFATLLSYGLRAYTWRKYKAFVDIQALQISLLGGRIFFKGFRYHGKNETILVQGGYLTWKYWLRSVKQVDCKRFMRENGERPRNNGIGREETTAGEKSFVGDDKEENGGIEEAKELPCRISIFTQGVEWIVYNRSPAYDAILSSNSLQSSVTKLHSSHQGGTRTSASGLEAYEKVDDHRRSRLRKDRRHRSDPELSEQDLESSSKRSYQSSKQSPTVENHADDLEGLANDPVEIASMADSANTTYLGKKDQAASLPLILNLLPISLDCQKGAVVLGNENTRVILTTVFDRAKGRIDASTSGPLDLYRQLFEFDVVHPISQMRPNPDFKQSQEEKAEQVEAGKVTEARQQTFRNWAIPVRQWRRKLTYMLGDLLPSFRSSVESVTPVPLASNQRRNYFEDFEATNRERPWLGLDRYMDEETRDDHAGWSSVEYARYSTLFDCPSVNFTFYWDVPGIKMLRADLQDGLNDTKKPPLNDINGADPPAYGLKVLLRGGIVNYGPWADRARTEIQNMFFPNPYTSVEPAEPLEVGSPRQSTVFKIEIEVMSETILRIPTREESKDWQWRGRADTIKDASKLRQRRNKKHSRDHKGDQSTLGPDIRPFGWLSLHIGSDSTIIFDMDMICRQGGYRNVLNFDVPHAKMTSSANHDLLWRSGAFTGQCDLSNPQSWNALHEWKFEITSNSLEMFILRDHMFLLTDLIADWGSSAPPDYWTFVPFHYNLQLVFNDLKLYLNANDSNIINNPSDLDDNTFLVIAGHRLDSKVKMPLEKYRPTQNSVNFMASLEDASLRLITPLWNTHRSFLSDHPVATLKHFTLDGAFNYNLNSSPALTDSLTLDLDGQSPRIFLHGFLIRYFINIKENYFGENIHFRTFEEFQEVLLSQNGIVPGVNATSTKKTNDLDVLLTVRAEDASILLPSNLYTRKDNVKLDLLLVESDMRFNNYYSDISADFHTIEASLESVSTEDLGASGTVSNVQLFVDGITIYGHRLFGTAPTEPTYVCNWDFKIGDVLGECSIVFLRTLIFGIRSFAFCLEDDENSLSITPRTTIRDITFLRAHANSLRLCFLVDDTALLFSGSSISLDFNDRAERFSSQLRANIPELVFSAIDRRTATRHRNSDASPALTHAYLTTAVTAEMISRKPKYAEEGFLQLKYVNAHDQRSQRVPWLSKISDFRQRQSRLTSNQQFPPALPLPSIPDPINVSLDVTLKTHDHQVHTRTLHRSSGSRLSSYCKHSNHHSMASAYSSSHRGQPFSNVSLSGMKFSSRWLPPHFTMLNVQPDQTDLPPKDSNHYEEPSGLSNTEGDIDLHTDNSAHHVGLFCHLRDGIRGFCKPMFFPALTKVLDELQPRHPADILDDLQIETMSPILSTTQAKSKPALVLDSYVRIPCLRIRLINTFRSPQRNDSILEHDQYDVLTENIQIKLRNRKQTKETSNMDHKPSKLVTHIFSKQISISISERAADRPIHKATVQGTMKDMTFWLSKGAQLNAKAQVRTIDLVTSGTKVEYLAALIHRTTEIVNPTVAKFKLIVSQRINRLQHLVHSLAESGRQLPDPVFLTRPSYVLRAANDHLRANDSWKIISRLRFTYRNLTIQQHEDLVSQCSATISSCPDNAKDNVLSIFDHWRTWDLAHVGNSEIMKSIWGMKSSDEIASSYRRSPVLLALMVGQMRLLLDPGPKQSEFVLANLNSDMCSEYRQESFIEPTEEHVSFTETVRIEAHCSECALKLNWEVTELVDDTVELFHQRPKSPAIPSNPDHTLNTSRSRSRTILVVFGTDSAAVTLDSVNLQVALESQDLKVSVFQTGAAPSFTSDFGANTILSSRSASAKVRSQCNILMTWRLFQPNTYISIVTEANAGNEQALMIAGTCRRLCFDMEQGILKVLEVINDVIADEVNAVRDILTRRSKLRSSPSSGSGSPKQKFRHRIHVAFFLDDYDLNVAVLPSLVYSLRGNVARTAIRPRLNGAMRIDIDVKQQQHQIRSKKARGQESVAALELPPVNGSALVRHTQDPVSIEIQAMIEKIRLDGGSVRAWVDTMMRPEVTRIFVEAQRKLRKIKHDIDNLPSMSYQPVEIEARKPSSLVYDARIGCSGLSIQTSARGIKNHGYDANLDFRLGLVASHVHNKDYERGSIFENPQLSLIIRQISFSLHRRSEFEDANFGKLSLGLSMTCVTEGDRSGSSLQSYKIATEAFLVELHPETAALVVDVAEHLQEQIRALEFPSEMKQLSSIRRITRTDLHSLHSLSAKNESESEGSTSNILLTSIFSVALKNIQILWVVEDASAVSPGRVLEDLVFSVRNIDLTTQQANAAKLTIEDLRVQLVPKDEEKSQRSLNSALLPEMIFNVAYISTRTDRRLAFQAAGKALDLRLTSDFIVPANVVQSSLAAASRELRQAKAFQALNATESEPKKPLFGGKHLASLLIDVDFAGAVVTMQARPEDEAPKSVFSVLKGPRRSKAERYGRVFQGASGNKATLRAPGIAFKTEYKDSGNEDPSLNAEVKVAASSNILYPSVVPLILEISSSVKEIMGETDAKSIAAETIQSQLSTKETSPSIDPGLFGHCKVNLGVWIQSQEFGLSCQPIARVAATARFDDTVITMNTVQAPDQERFFALLVSFNSLHISVQHVYSRESTASLDVKSIVVSLMNSKHVSSVTGLSAILKISPVQTSVNAKQLQDFLLFREIWYPAEIRNTPAGPAPPSNPEGQPYIVQRYQQVAAAGAFPWNAVVAIEELHVRLDLGQSLGRSTFTIHNLWASSRKRSNWEQYLCLGFENIGLESTGRMSGLIQLQHFKIRTSIRWPLSDNTFRQRPLIQASLGFAELRVKGSFDYQPFLIADITAFDFLMYNVREPDDDGNDRLVAILDGDKVQLFCTTTSASQGFALYQAIERLKQEKQAAYENSLRELDRYLRRKSIYQPAASSAMSSAVSKPDASSPRAPISLHTDVVVTLQALKVGAFPSTFFDNSIFKIEAHDAQVRFAVSVVNDRINSGLSLTLGQLRVALSSVQRASTTALGEVAVDDVISRATGSRGGTILKVPRVVATMQTWQTALSNHIDYIFKSSFEGKVDVGWNYSRISFIRGMWSAHSRALSQRLGKPLTQSAVQITGAPPPSSAAAESSASQVKDQDKITAVVNVPQSKFDYTAIEPPLIETPQLRDMGEATPPLEWIGLQRERLPNLTHQIIIVGLLEICREVEEAYGRILGDS